MSKIMLVGGPKDGETVDTGVITREIVVPEFASINLQSAPEIDPSTTQEHVYKFRYCPECHQNHHPHEMFYQGKGNPS